jgi:uncharacterized protein (TIGR02118 family)
MSISYFVRYEGAAQDRQAFLTYYRERHVPILGKLPGILRIVLHAPVDWQDPLAVTPDRFFLLVQMEFPSREDLALALKSDARLQARSDFSRFPQFNGTVFHQAVQSTEVFAR